MVVKNREVVDDNPNQLDLNTVANYIRLMDEQPNYVPPAIELIDNCVNIVTCLSKYLLNVHHHLLLILLP